MSTNRTSVCAFEHVPLQFQFRTAQLTRFDTRSLIHMTTRRGEGPLSTMLRANSTNSHNKLKQIESISSTQRFCMPDCRSFGREWEVVINLADTALLRSKHKYAVVQVSTNMIALRLDSFSKVSFSYHIHRAFCKARSTLGKKMAAGQIHY